MERDMQKIRSYKKQSMAFYSLQANKFKHVCVFSIEDMQSNNCSHTNSSKMIFFNLIINGECQQIFHHITVCLIDV